MELGGRAGPVNLRPSPGEGELPAPLFPGPPLLQSNVDPMVVLRGAVKGIFLVVTVAALILWATGIFKPAIVLVGVFWTLYGVARFVTDDVVDAGGDLLGRLLGNGGLSVAADSHGEIDTLAAQGHYQDAAERWFQVAATEGAPAQAMLRRAALLTGPLQDPGAAAGELTQYRDAPRLPLAPEEDVAIGLALGDIYEHRLHDPARAMYELRRLLDKYPATRHVKLIRNALRALKQQRFGDPTAPTPTP